VDYFENFLIIAAKTARRRHPHQEFV